MLGQRGGEGHLDARFGHVMAADRSEQRLQGIDVHQVAPDHCRQQIAFEDLPRRFDRFVRIPRTFTGNALSPLGSPVDLQASEQGVTVLLDPEAGAKGLQ